MVRIASTRQRIGARHSPARATLPSSTAAVLALGGAALVAFAASACGRSHEPAAEAETRTVDVSVVAARARELPEVFEAGGVVRARTTATVTSRLLAPVMEVRVRPGDRVKAGQVLVRLDDRDLSAASRRAASSRVSAEQGSRAAQAARDAAQAHLELVRATHKRIAALHARKSATDSELDQAVASLRSAEAQLATAEARAAESSAGASAAAAGAEAASINASWAAITAPFNGVVTEKLVEPGNMATPGMPLLRVEASGAARLEVSVDEARAQFVRRGQEVPIIFDVPPPGASTREHTGTIAEIARAAEAGAHAYLVKIELPANLSVLSGVYARAHLPGPVRKALVVPASSVVRRGQLTSVFVVDKERARLRLVSLGGTHHDAEAPDDAGSGLVEVLAGLDDGERVVAKPPPVLSDGVRVRISPARASRYEGDAPGSRPETSALPAAGSPAERSPAREGVRV
jgi:RND family efflux transporter MFP subunit